MSNALGLTLIGLGIAFIIAFVITVDYFAKNKPKTKIGKISKKINEVIERLPDNQQDDF